MSDDKLKLSAEQSKFICKLLDEGIRKLELVQALPLDKSDFEDEKDPVCHSIIDTKTFLPCHEIQWILQKEKFQSDCQSLTKTLLKLRDELNSSETFETLLIRVDDTAKELLELKHLMENFQELKASVDEVKKKLANRKEEETKENAELLNESFQVSISHQQQQIDLKVEQSYIETWVDSQVRQQELQLENSEDEEKMKLLGVAMSTLELEDVTNRTCKFYRQKVKELQEENDRMGADYFVQMENYEMEIQIALKTKSEVDKKIQQEHENFIRRQEEMNDYQARKRQKEADKKLLSLQKAKIVIIQAWWRGLMVRLFLGRFRSFKKRSRKIKKEFRAARAKKSKSKK